MSDVESSAEDGLTCDDDKVQCVGMASLLVYPVEQATEQEIWRELTPPLPDIVASLAR